MASTSAATLLVIAAHLLDPRSGKVLSPAAVLIDNGRIQQVASKIQPPSGATVIDLGGETLLPGLIDSHAHLFLNITMPSEAEINNRYNGFFAPGLLLAIAESPSKRVFIGAQMAREDLEAGFTTVRNLGHSGIDGDTALRDAINAGRVPGPRLLACARKIAQQSEDGYLQNLNPALATAIIEQEFRTISGPDSARQAVEDDLFYNVDVIKVADDDDISLEEMKAIVEEAHRQKVKVAVHAASASSIQTAIDAGVDSIEHGNAATDEQLKTMREKGIFLDLTPTFYGGRLTTFFEKSIVMSPELRSSRAVADERGNRRYEALVQRVLASGVKFAAGSDMCWFDPGRTRGEATAEALVSLRAAGMQAIDVLRAITTTAAEMIGWQDRAGAIEPGKFADLVAVAGDPLTDITELQRIRFVMKGGTVIRNDPPHR